MEQLFAALFLGASLIFFGQYSACAVGDKAARALLCLSICGFCAALWLILTQTASRDQLALRGARGVFLLLPTAFLFLCRVIPAPKKERRAYLLAFAAVWCLQIALYVCHSPSRAPFAAAYLFALCLLDARVLRARRAAPQKTALSEHYRKLAYRDALTDCASRMAYELDLERIAADKRTEGLRMVLFDLNDLKRINDHYGHLSGDDALINCARCIQRAFGACYRIGGDEFACVLHLLDDAAFDVMREKFFRAVRACDAKTAYPFAVSVGCAKCDGAAPPDLRALREQADKVLYEDKRRQKIAI